MNGPVTRFIVLSSARTGSTLLCNVLGASRDITCLNELLNPQLEQYGQPATPELKELRRNDIPAFVERIASNWTKPCFGFKIFPKHADEWLEGVLDDPNWKKIILYRENVLAAHSSRQIATARGKWSDTGTKAELSADENSHAIDDQTEFDADAFEKFRRQYQKPYTQWLTRLAETQQPFHFLEYGMLRNSRLLAGACSFLGAKPPASFKSNIVKTSSSHILSRFSNADDVRDYLAGIGRLDWQAESFLEI
jgi:hypothetical protein